MNELNRKALFPTPQTHKADPFSGEFSCHLTEDLVGIQMTVPPPPPAPHRTCTTNDRFICFCRLANSRETSLPLPLPRSAHSCSCFLFRRTWSHAAQHDRTGEYPTQIIKQAWELGLVRALLPVEHE
jgi:hypothetical protein